MLKDPKPFYRTVTVVGKVGQYGWSRRLRPSESCILARWAGDPVGLSELESRLDGFVAERRITGLQRDAFYEAIQLIDDHHGDAESLALIRSFAKILGMRCIARKREKMRPRRIIELEARRFERWLARGVPHKPPTQVRTSARI